MTKNMETRHRLAVCIADGQQRAFAHQLKTMEEAFRPSKPDARQRAVRLRDRALASVGRLSESAAFARSRAAHARRDGAAALAAQQERRARFLEAAARRYEDAVESIDGQLARHRRALAGDDDLGPTPERMVKRLLPDGVTRLVQVGALDFAHLRAAHEIARIYEMSTIEVRAATLTPAPGTRGRRPAAPDLMSEGIAERRQMRYLPWIRDMQARKNIDLALVLDVVVHGLSLEAARKVCQVSWRRARDMVVEALDQYARLQAARR